MRWGWPSLNQRFEVITSSLNQNLSDKSETCVESSLSARRSAAEIQPFCIFVLRFGG